MDLSTFIITVFCLIDDRLKYLGRLRERGPTPTLYDSEVLTIEVVGEYSVDALHSSLGEANFMPLGSYDVRSPSLVGGPQLAVETAARCVAKLGAMP